MKPRSASSGSTFTPFSAVAAVAAGGVVSAAGSLWGVADSSVGCSVLPPHWGGASLAALAKDCVL